MLLDFSKVRDLDSLLVLMCVIFLLYLYTVSSNENTLIKLVGLTSIIKFDNFNKIKENQLHCISYRVFITGI